MRQGGRQRNDQRGAALMIMMIVLVLGVAALLVRELAGHAHHDARSDRTARILAEAREALLGYAASFDAANPASAGLLPCPDLDVSGGFAEGEAHATACGDRHRSALGRLPWKTLGLAPARGVLGECLWYAVSGSWKAAGASAPQLLNTDSNGQFRVFADDGSTLIAGEAAADRAVAVIIAPGAALGGQLRNVLAGGTEHCSGNYRAARYLDADAVSGINNATLAASADAVDDFIQAAAGRDDINDRLVFITRSQIEERLLRRADLWSQLTALTGVVARCVAEYGRRNATDPADHRLPWPAPLALSDYRTDTAYDDTPVGFLSGRLPDRVNDSAARTGNALTHVLNDCAAASVPEWTTAMQALWSQWKDHFFYAVAASFRPDATPHSSCGTCLTVNGSGSWAAVVMFAGPRLADLGQIRDAPPIDSDTRGVIGNYLEGRNAANHPNPAGDGDYQSGAANATFNDVLACIAPDLSVTPC